LNQKYGGKIPWINNTSMVTFYMETNTTTFTIYNWSGQYSSKPGIFVVPETVADLKEIIQNKVKFPSPAVALASGHSNSGYNVVNAGTARLVIITPAH